MALNWTMLDPARNPIPLPHETSISVKSGAELQLHVPDAPPAAGATAGGAGGSRKLKATGKLHLTDQRLVFASDGSDASLASLTVPLHSILSTEFVQPPLFGENYLKFTIKPSPNGGLTEGTVGQLRLKDQPMFQVVAQLEKLRERAIYMARQTLQPEEGLPRYSSPYQAETASSNTSPNNNIPSDAPPGYDA
ncbi:hypothetical protein FISHEDRAFT_64175 [Fistulina hepatica ATCC 64428]|uniref:GRAM domain-containing protein n=1 Tax=Fistulina hepatica ATCC 64428 TaxID=1128425 RepID=A0A0D7AJ99_9AGAR|nr:hypothetical protein FISHEDRAFT_64175 [Fistulina hepatica ATCC 64428]